MHTIEIGSIVIPDNRQRKEFREDAHADLMASIDSKGLLHPLTLRKIGDGRVQLVAGERRLRAMQALIAMGKSIRCNGETMPEKCVPFLYLGELDPTDAYEAELEENVCRLDLSPIEKIEARKALFELRKKKAEAAGESYRAVDFADEMKRAGASAASTTQVLQSLAVAQFVNDPAVRKARTMSEAHKAAKRSMQNFLTEALGEALEGIGPMKHQFFEGDALDVLGTLDSNRFDCVLTDPPYGIDIDDSGSMVTNEHHYDDSAETLERIIDRVPYQLYRITRPQAHVYWFCDIRWFAKISFALEEAGFSVWHRPIIWWKRGKAMAADITRWPRTETEWIIYAIKGDKAPLKVAGDVIATSYGSDLQQAEKPKELFVELLSRSVLEGSQVIDPFCGSGAIFTAASELNCAATGIELDAARADLARIRAHGM